MIQSLDSSHAGVQQFTRNSVFFVFVFVSLGNSTALRTQKVLLKGTECDKGGRFQLRVQRICIN